MISEVKKLTINLIGCRFANSQTRSQSFRFSRCMSSFLFQAKFLRLGFISPHSFNILFPSDMPAFLRQNVHFRLKKLNYFGVVSELKMNLNGNSFLGSETTCRRPPMKKNVPKAEEFTYVKLTTLLEENFPGAKDRSFIKKDNVLNTVKIDFPSKKKTRAKHCPKHSS